MYSGRLVAKTNDKLFILASYRLEEDGSIYLFLVREGSNDHSISFGGDSAEPMRKEFDAPRPKTKKISYHASGVVRYHNMGRPTIYLEPLCRLTSINPVAAYILPSLEKLDELVTLEDRDFVLDVAQDGPIQFSFSVAPWQHVPQVEHCAIRWSELFALIVEVTAPTVDIPSGLADYVTTVTPSKGFSAPVMDEPTAFSRFHQLLNNTRDCVIYSPNANGEYRIVCAVPMRISPRLEIRFFDEQYVAEQSPPHIKRGTVEVRFRVRGKGGYLKHEVPIAFVALHAEL